MLVCHRLTIVAGVGVVGIHVRRSCPSISNPAGLRATRRYRPAIRGNASAVDEITAAGRHGRSLSSTGSSAISPPVGGHGRESIEARRMLSVLAICADVHSRKSNTAATGRQTPPVQRRRAPRFALIADRARRAIGEHALRGYRQSLISMAPATAAFNSFAKVNPDPRSYCIQQFVGQPPRATAALIGSNTRCSTSFWRWMPPTWLCPRRPSPATTRLGILVTADADFHRQPTQNRDRPISAIERRNRRAHESL